MIKKALEESSPITFFDNLEKASSILQAEHRHVPYSLPKLSFDPPSEEKSNSVSGVCKIDSGEESFNIYWEVLDNPLFVSHQTWRYKGSRSFKSSVEYGILEGMEQMKRNFRAKI